MGNPTNNASGSDTLKTASELIDIRELVSYDYAVSQEDTLEEVFRVFQTHDHEYMAVLRKQKVVGLCSRNIVGMRLGSRFGFSIFSSRPIREQLLPDHLTISIKTPLGLVLRQVFSRSGEAFYQDVALVDATGEFIGLIPVYRLVRLQNGILNEKIDLLQDLEGELRMQTKELDAANNQLAQSRDQAVESTKLKSEFLANMSHEIRTPMNGVLGMLSLLLDSQLDSEQKHFANTAYTSAESLLHLINDILDLSKMEAGKMDISPSLFNIRELVDSAAQLLAERAASGELELCCDVDTHIPLDVYCDAQRYRQVLLNLLGNAIKFTPGGSVCVYLRIHEHPRRGLSLRTEVVDTGIGIAANMVEKLFAPFVQADGSISRRFGGTGLGLAISRRIVELMHGEIGCSSEPGKGSTFYFELPCEPPRGETLTPYQPQSLSGKRILLVEGNSIARDIQLKHLTAAGADMHSCACPEEAMAILETPGVQHPFFDMLLVDRTLPGGNGIELCQKIRELAPYADTPIAIITTLGNPVPPPVMEALKIACYLYKPVRTSEQLEVIYHNTQERHPDSLLPWKPKEAPRANLSSVRSVDAVVHSLRVLVVEDSPTNQEVARFQLQRLGHLPVIVPDGYQAINSLKKDSFDCVLMDCQMPYMDGFQTTRLIREGSAGEDCKTIPIIAMTANAMEGDREKCLASGMDDYVSKPVVNIELQAVLETNILRHRKEHPGSTPAPQTGAIATPDNSRNQMRLATIADNDEAFFKELIEVFCRDGDKLITRIGDALHHENREKLELYAHTLKGNAGSFKAEELARIAQHLETEAENGSFANMEALFLKLSRAYEDLKRELTAFAAD